MNPLKSTEKISTKNDWRVSISNQKKSKPDLGKILQIHEVTSGKRGE